MANKSGVAEQIPSLPKGGGSIKGLGEKFQPDLHTGTGNFSIPITVPPGRNGFQPQLSLNYSTGPGNGPFGLGWSIRLPNVRRKTSKGIPHYQDKFDDQENPIWHEDEDVFILSGAEDLVHVGNGYYRPRTEGLFARIQKVRAPDGNPCWVVTAKNGVRSIYGNTPESRLFVEENGATKIFQWLLSVPEDTNGNKIIYEYKKDDGADLQADLATRPEERNHTYNQVYLKSIAYVNYQEPSVAEEKYLWKIELDYGEYDDACNEVKGWDVRPDPFSSYRSGFEIRTARRCERILIKRRLEDIADQYELIRSYELKYKQAPLSNTSRLTEVILHGHKDGVIGSFPPLTFSYTEFDPTQHKYETFSAQCDCLPEKSLSDSNYELIDPHGNGLPDIIHTASTGYRCWRNLGNMRLSFPRPMKHAPVGVTLADDGVQFADMEGNGSADLLVTTGAMRGYYANDFSGEWQQFHHYHQAPSFDLKNPNVKLVDMDGDGVIDVLATYQHYFLYICNTNRGNGLAFAQPEAIPRKHELDDFPDVFFGAPDQRVRLADMTGDGIQDIVLIHDRLIQYWPNLGHGKFGKQITMWNAPYLPYRFDPKWLFLSDVNGNGLADLIYVDFGKVHLWINQNGNRWSDEVVIYGTPPVTDADSVRVADMKGTGTAGLLWSYDYALQNRTNYKYLDFTGGVKPLLMSSIDNHIGAKTTIEYRPSTDFYIADAEAGRPWKTMLPFPVQVVSKVIVEDQVTGNKLTTRYTYHHGYYDGKEREFRGFGMVEQFDAETFERYKEKDLHGEEVDFDFEEMHYSPPTLTKNWFHQGIDVDEKTSYDFADEFWEGDQDETAANLKEPLSGKTLRDAYRAFRGVILRTELYALDKQQAEEAGLPDRSDRPYTVTKNRYEVREEKDGSPIGSSLLDNQKIFFPYRVETRKTQWARGTDPMINRTEFAPPDAYGRQTERTKVGEPRQGTADRRLILKTITRYATLDKQGIGFVPNQSYQPTYIVDRICEEIHLNEAGKVVGQTQNFYDGQDFQGLDLGKVTRGNLMRIQKLVFDAAILNEAYSSLPTVIGGETLGLSAENLPQHHYTDETGINPPEDKYWVQTVRNKYKTNYGIVEKIKDSRGHDASIVYDDYDLFPKHVEDALKLTPRLSMITKHGRPLNELIQTGTK